MRKITRYIKRQLPAMFCAMLVIILASCLFTVQNSSAAAPTVTPPIKTENGCTPKDSSEQPLRYTAVGTTACLGVAMPATIYGGTYYQIAIVLTQEPTGIVSILTTNKDSNNEQLNFAQSPYSKQIYLSQPTSTNTGYVARNALNGECHKEDAVNQLKITVKVNNSSTAPGVFDFNICDDNSLTETMAKNNPSSLIIVKTYDFANPGSSNTGSEADGKGVLKGSFQIKRDWVTEYTKKGNTSILPETELIDKNGIVSLKVSKDGGDFVEYKKTDFSVANGTITIPATSNLDYGEYKIRIEYSDFNYIINSGTIDGTAYVTQRQIVEPDFFGGTEQGLIVYEQTVTLDSGEKWFVTDKPTTLVDVAYTTPVVPPTIQPLTCGSEVKGVGWIVCPIISALSTVNDMMWGLVSGLLHVNPISQTGSTSAIYTAWGSIRNIANVVFVIVFLVMIFSQLSSFGISNYGIKKLLPRLIIGAILVNISFLVVQISVDLANIVGNSLYNLLIGLAPKIQPGGWQVLVNLLTGAAVTGGIAIGAVAIAGSVGGLFYIILPFAAMGALGLLAAVITLIFRQAVIPVLAILAPLAFVAALLPNTESWFKKWKDLMVTMLMLYPLAALVFGGAQFAAGIVIGDATNWWNLLIGLVMLTLPLFSLPFLATKSGAIVSKVGTALNGLANKAKSPIDKFSKEHADLEKDKANNRAMNDKRMDKNGKPRFNGRRSYLQRKAKFAAIGQSQKDEFNQTQSKYIAKEITEEGNTLLGKMVSGGSPEALDRAKARAVTAVNKAEDEQVANAAILIKSETTAVNRKAETKKMLEQAINDHDNIKARAAMSILLTMSTPGIEGVHEIIGGITEDATNRETLNKLRSDVNAAGLKGKDNALATWGYAASTDGSGNGISISQAQSMPDTYAKLNPVELSGQSDEILKKVKDLKKADGVTFAISGEQARNTLTNPNAAQNLTAEKIAILNEISARDPAVLAPAQEATTTPLDNPDDYNI